MGAGAQCRTTSANSLDSLAALRSAAKCERWSVSRIRTRSSLAGAAGGAMAADSAPGAAGPAADSGLRESGPALGPSGSGSAGSGRRSGLAGTRFSQAVDIYARLPLVAAATAYASFHSDQKGIDKADESQQKNTFFC